MNKTILLLLLITGAEASVQAPSLVLTDELWFGLDFAEPVLNVTVEIDGEIVEGLLENDAYKIETPAPGFHAWKILVDHNGTDFAGSGVVQTFDLGILQQGLSEIGGDPRLDMAVDNATQAKQAAYESLLSLQNLDFPAFPSDYARQGVLDEVKTAVDGDEKDDLAAKVESTGRQMWITTGILGVLLAGFVAVSLMRWQEQRRSATHLEKSFPLLMALAKIHNIDAASLVIEAETVPDPVLEDTTDGRKGGK